MMPFFRWSDRRPRWVVVSSIAVTLMSGVAAAREVPRPENRQYQDIDALVREIDYLIDHTERLATRYRQDPAPIRFNYPALLKQLRLTRDRAAAYLNEAHGAVLHAPPSPERASLTRRY